MRNQQEKTLAQAVSDFLQSKYPNVIYRFDYGADVKLTVGQGAKMKRLQGKWSKGMPDLVIYEPRGEYHAMFLELKKDREAIFKKDGKYRQNEHLKTQVDMMIKLSDRGYYTAFGCGFKESIEKINKYLSHK